MESGSAGSEAGQTANSQTFQSPALAANIQGSADAYEMKCLLDEATASALEQLLSSQLQMDQFCAKSPEGQYRIITLATDTQDFSVFSRSPGFGQRKFRIRRYGSESWAYLERKTRRGNRVRKLRSRIDLAELTKLAEPSLDDSDSWEGNWFKTAVRQRLLQPTCLMTYERRAWFGNSENGPVRLTFDRNLMAGITTGWNTDASGLSIPVTDGMVVCEFKFSDSMPVLFKSAIQQFGLSPRGFSKYRNCLAHLTGMSVPSASIQRDSAAAEAEPGRSDRA
jgi:hypothetical protein